MDNNGGNSGSGVTILAEEFLADLGYRRYSPRTLEIYRQALVDFNRFLGTNGIGRAQDVTGPIVEDYRRHLQGRQFSAAGEETYTRAVKRFFDYLESKQRVFANPFEGSGPLRRAKKLMPVPSEEEMRALLAAPDVTKPAGVRSRAILEVAYSTAARLAELTRLKLGDLDLDSGTVRLLGKGSRERVAPLGAAAVEWTRKYVAEVRSRHARPGTAALWVTPGGEPLSSESVGQAVRTCARKAGTVTPITPHAIRRACATHMLGHGAHPVQLQMLLGHASLRHLSQYLRVSFHELRAMHERSRLGQ